MVIISEDDILHYGILRRSGRYPWGSSSSQNVRNKSFLDYVDDLRREGLSDTQIAQGLGISTTRLRAARTIANNQQKQAKISQAQRLKDKGLSNVAIGERMGINESSVRALLADGAKDKADILTATSSMLKDQVDKKKFVDIGSGVEQHLGISEQKLDAAVALLREEGYEVHSVDVLQLGTGLNTKMKILAPPGTTQKDVWLGRDQIKQITDYSDDGGRTFLGIRTPKPVSIDRVGIRYDEDGGGKADGVIYVRPGVDNVSLGNSRYAQVRVQVGDGHYLKGMAMYKDDLPDGVDLVFNTNKKDTGNKLDAMKELSDDPDNPFGAVIRRQIGKKDENGNLLEVTSAMNLVNEEGDWTRWSKTLATQVLSKQSPRLAKTQLDATFEDRQREFAEISALTNPTVRRKLLKDFADGVDSASVHLKAAGIKGQAWHAILPIDSLPPTQIYAPNFKDGDRVVLIRYPHGGTFEIPDLVVNNNHPESKRLLGQARDAVGIHHSVAERLSGADFDGDTVLVIPNNNNRIISTPALEGLKNFYPQESYPAYEGMPRMTARQKGQEMGAVSNLITDMTVRGASTGDLAAAIRHSMVVIDAEKHNLNYKESAVANGIPALKAKYQGSGRSGASTLFSKAQAEIRVPERKERSAARGGPIDKETGKRVFEETGALNYRTGKPKLIKSKRLAETDDAHTLSSGRPIERLYADHSNRLKSMANAARVELVNTPPLKYSPSAKKVYHAEVKSLDAKLALAIRNRPLERQAQVIANTVIKAKRDSNPDMDEPTLKKIKYQALQEARNRTGAQPQRIRLTQEEWNAIQAGAISDSKLSAILDNADMDVVRSLATPKPTLLMTSAKTRRAEAMAASGYTRAEIASALGVSLTTLDTAIHSALNITSNEWEDDDDD